jgi:hypothetical protein
MSSDGQSQASARAIDLLVKVARCVEPVEHVGGRITLRVPWSGLPKLLTLLSGIDVDEGARAIPGLMGYEVSTWSLSATIRYDPKVLPADLWNDFCAIRKSSGAETSFRSRLFELIEDHSAPAMDTGGE